MLILDADTQCLNEVSVKQALACSTLLRFHALMRYGTSSHRNYKNYYIARDSSLYCVQAPEDGSVKESISKLSFFSPYKQCLSVFPCKCPVNQSDAPVPSSTYLEEIKKVKASTLKKSCGDWCFTKIKSRLKLHGIAVFVAGWLPLSAAIKHSFYLSWKSFLLLSKSNTVPLRLPRLIKRHFIVFPRFCALSVKLNGNKNEKRKV